MVPPCPSCGSTSRQLPSLDQLRADALVEAGQLLATHMQTSTGVSTEELTARRGARWRHAVVVTDLPTALGLADEPGWVPGYGYIPADISRELLAEATTWQRFLLDDHGRITGIGATTYRPSARLRDLVTARDLICTFPGCERCATTTDLDHRTNFNGTNTTAANLHPLCRTHHRLKTHTGWTVTRDPQGIDHWHAPNGTEYLQQPPQPPWPTPHTTSTGGNLSKPTPNQATSVGSQPTGASDRLEADPATPAKRGTSESMREVSEQNQGATDHDPGQHINAPPAE